MRNAISATRTDRREASIGANMTVSPWTVGKGASLAEAGRIMSDHHVRHLPVLDGGKLVGIVSQRDLYLVESLPGVSPEAVSVEEAMVPDPFQVRSDTPVWQAIDTMIERKLGSALVCDGDKVVGVFTTIDALRLLAERLKARG